MPSDPDPPFVAVWNNVVAELNGETRPIDTINGDSSLPSLTPQQRAWLKLVKPLVITEGQIDDFLKALPVVLDKGGAA